MGKMTRPYVDVVAFLEDQHRDIEDLLHELPGMHGPARAKAFFALRSLLAAHEAAEETIVHPLARRVVPFGEFIVAARTGEERRLAKTLAFLETVDVDSDAFETQFRLLRERVIEHIDLEEREELEHLRDVFDGEQLERMRIATEVVEEIVPGHPSSGVETLTARALDDHRDDRD